MQSMDNPKTKKPSRKKKEESEKPSMFMIEKARRDVIFRDKNAVNFNITGEKSYKKSFPIKKVKKVYYNDILSYEDFIENKIKESLNDKSLDLKPMSRNLKEVLTNKKNIVAVKAQNMNEALNEYIEETEAEYVEKLPFNESDGDEFESPEGKLPSPEERYKKK